MAFEWNTAKSLANLSRHGVDFADAVAVFEDPFALTRPDSDARGEARFIMLGTDAFGRLLVVVFAARQHYPYHFCSCGIVEGAHIL